MPVSNYTQTTVAGWITDAEKRAAHHHTLEKRYGVGSTTLRLFTTVCSSVLGGSEFVRLMSNPLHHSTGAQLEATEEDEDSRLNWQTVVGIVFASLTLGCNAIEQAINPSARHALHRSKRLAYENFAREARLGLATFDTAQAEKGFLEELESALTEIANLK